jgi:hypothetical protein
MEIQQWEERGRELVIRTLNTESGEWNSDLDTLDLGDSGRYGNAEGSAMCMALSSNDPLQEQPHVADPLSFSLMIEPLVGESDRMVVADSATSKQAKHRVLA